MKQVWSSGGGVQSSAIAVLILQGKLPKPDYAFIADTGREKETTWKYLDAIVNPALATIGLQVERIKKSDYATVDLYSGNGDLLIPAFTTQNGKISKLPTFCSNEWKQRVIRRHMRAIGIEEAEVWLGISLDEMSRVRVSDVGWIKNRYPLIWDFARRRVECVYLVEQHGWPSPPRSACRMCPNMHNDEWLQMKQESPEDFQKAVALEKSIRAKDEHIFLHKTAVLLDEVDFDKESEDEDGGCMSGLCFV